MNRIDKLALDFETRIVEKLLVFTYQTFGFSVNIHEKKKKNMFFKTQRQIC